MFTHRLKHMFTDIFWTHADTHLYRFLHTSLQAYLHTSSQTSVRTGLYKGFHTCLQTKNLKKIKWKTTSKKKNQQNIWKTASKKKWKTTSKNMEDELKKKWKTTSTFC